MELLNISKKQQFGIEIEYLNSEKNKVEDQLYEAFINDGLNQDWHRDREDTISHPDGSDFVGELVSPILHNQLNDLRQIKYACELLLGLRAMTDQQCGGHIHFDPRILNGYADLKDNHLPIELVNNLRNLILVQLNYEDVLFRYAAGEDEYIREGVADFAIPLNLAIKTKDIKKYLYDEISEEDFCSWLKTWSRNYAINLRRLIDRKTEKTIEIRFPNGTLNDQIWYNNINFFGSILEYIPSITLETKEKLYKNVMINKPYFKANCKRLNLVKAHELANLVLKDEQDKEKFIKQYRK